MKAMLLCYALAVVLAIAVMNYFQQQGESFLKSLLVGAGGGALGSYALLQGAFLLMARWRKK